MMSFALTRAVSRIAASAVVVAALLPGRSAAQDAAAGATTINTTSAGYLGIMGLRCDCTLSADPDVRKRFFVFRSEPVVTRIDAGSPAAGRIMRGDAITHVDGMSLRTAEGARRFASIQPGQSVEIALRRSGRASRVRLEAEALDWNDRRVLGNTAPEGGSGYSMTWDFPDPPAMPANPVIPAMPADPPGASVAPPALPAQPAVPPGLAPRSSWAVVTPRPPRVPRPAVAPVVPRMPWPRGWFGFSIRCNDCGWSSSDRPGASPVWESKTAPELSMVAAGSPAARAGFRPGDVLTHIDGVSILTDAGARKFGGVRPGQKVRVTVTRDGKPITRELTLTRRPEARAAVAAAAAIAGTAPRPATPAARRELRYTGRLEDVTVEVFSAGGPTVERIGDTMVISVAGTVVRLKVDPKQ